MYLRGDGFGIAAESVLRELGQLHREKNTGSGRPPSCKGGAPPPASLPMPLVKDTRGRSGIPCLLRTSRDDPPPHTAQPKGSSTRRAAQGPPVPGRGAHSEAGPRHPVAGPQLTPSFGSQFFSCCCPRDALEQPTRELGEALLIWARTRASPQAVARTQRTGKSRGRMGRTPLTWGSMNHTEASQRAAGLRRGRDGRPSPAPKPFPE